MIPDITIAAVIAAAGSSTRFENSIKKEYHPFVDVIGGAAPVDGKPLTVLGAAVLAFAAVPRISRIVIVVPPNQDAGECAARRALPDRLLDPAASPRITFTPGGRTRCSSVRHGLAFLKNSPPDYVLIHDGARPWISGCLIDRVIDSMIVHKAAIPVLSSRDTFVECDSGGSVTRLIPNASIVAAQTPQGFEFSSILKAHEDAARLMGSAKPEYTDDAEIWGEFIGSLATVSGEDANRKITYPEDLPSHPAGPSCQDNETSGQRNKYCVRVRDA
jgi:2-C-methyl-D-erythritol 4-phosphate cytidylyltransferase